tara:strand:- start:366 stop:560 length:195 start_codon:yes stop_codon:yes gene_type:complete
MNISNRKLVCAGVCFLAASIFVALGKADFTGWAEFVKWIFGIYAAGNVGEHAASKVEINTPTGE